MERQRYQPTQLEQGEQIVRPDRTGIILAKFLGDQDTLNKLLHTRGTNTLRMEARNALTSLTIEEQTAAAEKLIIGLSKDKDKTRRRGAEILLKQINLTRIDSDFLKKTYIAAIENQDPTPNTGIDYALRRVGKILDPYLPEGPETKKEITYAWDQAKPNHDREIAELRKQGLLSHEISERQGIIFTPTDMKAARERFRRKGENLEPLTRGGLKSNIDRRRTLVKQLDEQGFTPKEIAEKLGEKRDVIRRDLYLQRKTEKN